MRAAAGLAAGVLLLHIVTNFVTPYEFHRDEFLYLAMGEHLRLWRMDFPPFIAMMGRLSHAIFGTSLAGIRLGPAVSHALLVMCAAWTTWAFGGRRSAQALAALAIATSPLFLRSGALFQPVAFDQLWWTLALVSLVLRIRENDLKHWFGVGIFLGLGALTKFSVAFIAAGVLVAVLVTPLRRDLLTRWPWLALVIATVIGHPSVVGQIALGWPIRGQMASLQSTQLARVGMLDFLTGQLENGPIVLLAIFGLVALFMPRLLPRGTLHAAGSGNRQAGSRSHLYGTGAPALDWRPIGIAALTPFVLLLVLHGKAYYAGPIYPILAAGGAAALDRLGESISAKRPTKLLALAAAVVALYGLVTLPFGLPLLAPPDMSRYAQLAAPPGATTTNTGKVLALPQDYADMLGWSALADTVVRVWRSLPPSDTARAMLIGTNYGRAGALDLLGRSRGLPPVVSPVGSYWFFGPGNRPGDVAVVVANDDRRLHDFFREVTEVAHTQNPWGVPEEQTVRVYVCRQPLRSLSAAWPSLAGRN